MCCVGLFLFFISRSTFDTFRLKGELSLKLVAEALDCLLTFIGYLPNALYRIVSIIYF